MLKRAIASVQNQTYENLIVKVVNDDPDDFEVSKIIRSFTDERIYLFMPVQKRGATKNFNLAFSDPTVSYVSILEDDNWWEPTFLEEMYRAIERHPSVNVVAGNETIWKELENGTWENTGKTIWNFTGLQTYSYSLAQICGSAKLCNSSMLVRLNEQHSFKTPDDIPVDVTEHFRERLFSVPILLLGTPLVNYAETIKTARSTKGNTWGIYQVLLTGSAFIALPNRVERQWLADELWRCCTDHTSPRAVSLVSTGFCIREARSLLRRAPLVAKIRFFVSALRKPRNFRAMAVLRKQYNDHLRFLVEAPLTQHLVRSQGMAAH
jgi:glycosyltransferase involved in cell wall biosynthesis